MRNRVVKLEASAGSGKTYQLTLEYLDRIFRSFTKQKAGKTEGTISEQLLGSIIAITFTNKAANEMKERVLDKLKAFSVADKADDLDPGDQYFLAELSKKTGIKKEKILYSSDLILNIIIASYEDFNIKTIDSLMSSIIKVISVDLELDADYEIGIDASDELKFKAGIFLNEISNHNWDLVENFLLDYSNISPVEKWNIDTDIIKSIASLFRLNLHQKDGCKLVTEQVINKFRTQVFANLQIFRKELGNLFKFMKDCKNRGQNYFKGNILNKNLFEAVERLLIEQENKKSLKVIENLTSKAFFKYKEGEDLCKKDTPRNILSLFSVFHKTMRNSLQRLIADISVFRVIHYVRFFGRFVKFWEKHREKLYVEEFSKIIKDKLTEWGEFALPYIYLKLSDRFIHFLIDEFQDTSAVQFNALSPIIDEVLSSRQDSSFFCVGDRKQAIYRWRGGNSEIMNEENLLGEINNLKNIGDKNLSSTLVSNWRSSKEIIKFNNNFWDPDILIKIPELVKIREQVKRNFASSRQDIPLLRKDIKGYVRIDLKRFQAKTAREIKMAKLHQDIHGFIEECLSKGYDCGDIAILVRKNDEGREIIKYLSGKGIECISEESLFLLSSIYLNEIICFFKFLTYPPDNLSFYSFVKGSIFKREGLKKYPEELKKIIKNDFYDSDTKVSYYKSFSHACPLSWNFFIAPFFKSVGFLPPYDIFCDFIKKFRLYENFKNSAPFFISLAEKLHELEQEGVNSLSAFLEEWEKQKDQKEKYSVDIREDKTRIKVLTIHKSKGLEFPVTIVPVTEDRGGMNNLYWDKGNLYYIKREYAALNEKLKKLYEKEVNNQYIDDLNLYYVGFTRPAEVLYIPAVEQVTKKDKQDKLPVHRSFCRLFFHHPVFNFNNDNCDSKIIEFGKFIAREQTSPVKDTPSLKATSKLVSTEKWQKDFLVFYAGELKPEEERNRIKKGEACHNLLEKIIKITAKEQIPVLIKSLAVGNDLTSEDINNLINFISDDKVYRFFNNDYRVFNEIEVADCNQGVHEYKRIDRLLVKGDEFIVIDYKTGEKDKSHHQQVKEYIEILAKIFKGYRPKGFILYINQNCLEEVEC